MLVLLQYKNAIKLELNITMPWPLGVQDASHQIQYTIILLL